ncbi:MULTISPECIES: JmjC domain-containing protein [unclassified Streptomyces]|uniref:JmjC domain-containing protein n=1 Tax=unclassified Streptomyces TaxID=2593676 RepID=UPI002E2EE6CA|nr:MULTISPECIES: cupin domain-containing protein [unclassified Streptomyces]
MTTAIDAAVRSLGGEFLAEAFGRSYQHWSQAADLSGMFTWDDLNDLVARHRLDAPRLRLFNDGEQVPPYEYLHTSITKRSEVRHRVEPSGLHQQISAGASLVLDAVDKLHPGVQALAEALERHFRTDVQANLYASWHPTEAFGIHWDDHDTVIFQLEGAKRWNLYGATRTDPLRLDVEAPEKPTGPPLAKVILQAGDMLYVPRGWWHAVAATQGRSLHLTCGLTPVTGHHLLLWLAGQLLHSPTLRAGVPIVAGPAERTAYAEQLRKEVSEALHPHIVSEFAASLDARDPGRPAPSLPYIDDVPADPGLVLALTTARAALEAADEAVVLRAAGHEWELHPSVRPALEALVSGARLTLGELADRSGLTVEQVAALATELVSKDAAAVSQPR